MTIRLTPFSDTTIPTMIRWASTPELLFNWMGSSIDYPLTEEQIRDYMKDAHTSPPTLYIYTAVNEQDKPIGHIEIGRVNRVNDYARIERVLVSDDAERGRGIGTEMVRQLCPIAFQELKLNRLELLVFEDNLPAIRCYEKAGFVTEGIMRKARKRGAEYVDIRMMSMLAGERPDNAVAS